MRARRTVDHAPRVFHYTIEEQMRQIVASGEIRPATAFVPKGERPVVWFSTNPVWEPTASKGIVTADGRFQRLSDAEMDDIGRARIEVRPHAASHDWSDFRRLALATKEVADQLARTARNQGSSASNFRFSLKPVPAADWLAIERWDGTRWVDARRSVESGERET